MKAARWTGYLLLPIAFLLERFAWFAVRSILWEHVAGGGAAFADRASAVSRTVSWLVVLSPIAGAATGYAVGARRTLMIGMLGTCAGYLLLLQGTVWPGAIVVALGLGLARPAFLAVAGAVSPDPVEAPRTTLFLLLYAMNTLAGLGGPGLASSARRPDETVWILGGAALLLVIATTLAGIHLLVVRAKAVPEPDAARGAEPARGAAVVLGTLVLAICAERLGAGILAQGPFAGQAPPWLHPALVIVFLLMLGLVWLGLSIGRARVSAAVPAAFGLLVLALATFPIGVSLANLGWKYQDLQSLALVVATGFLAAGEALVMACLLSRLCAGAARRWSVATAASWLLATSATSALLGATTPDSPIAQGIGFVLVAVACVVAGILLIARRARLRALFEGAPA